MSGVDAAATAPEPPSKRRKVHDDNSTDSTPVRHYDAADKADDKHTLRVSIREKTLDSPSMTPSRSRSPSRSRDRSRPRRRDTDDYSSDRSRHSISPTSSTRSRLRSPSSSRSSSRSRLRSRTPRSRSRSPSQSDSRSPSPGSQLRDDAALAARDAPPPSRQHPQPAKPHYVARMVLTGHTNGISQVRISPDGRWIASSSADGTVRIWDAASGAHAETLVGHMAGVSAVAWSPDSATLASGSDDKAIRLWDRVTGRPRARAGGKPLLGHHNYVYCLAFSPKGNILASGSYDEAVFLWDVRAGRLMRSLPAHSDPVSGIDFCRDGTLVVSCSTDGLTRIWDTSTGQCLRTLVHEDNPPVTSVCFAPNGRYVLAFSMDSCLRLWDYVSGTVKKTYQGHQNSGFSIGGCFGTVPSSSSDNDDNSNGTSDESGRAFIAAPSEDGAVVLWDVKTKEVVQRIDGAHDGVCFWVDVHGDTMVSAGKDGRIKVYKHRRPGAASAKVNGVAAAGAKDVNMEDGVAATANGDGTGSISPLKDEDVKKED
ncbi:WD40 repeat-like protein [Annulohypoxylon truncatum]|uniref:WD40 repeat-like protein n=1 Tax=Annulohypoxylon truncatum TaxID=327061 RepID=UPI00200796DA|nr:WD40 repeat-like protein [Annulohypoxylon truncatum]KAI1213899.1 WD40 repeat-like protein [Annulohypoxylon truncatum]